MIVRNTQKVLDFVNSVLLPQKEDIFSDYLWNQKISYGDKTFEIMMKLKHNPRGRIDPLELNPDTSRCFCDFAKSSPSSRIELNDSFTVFVYRAQPKLVLAASECGPEPKPENFEMMLRVTQSLKNSDSFLTVSNINGSGASIPQHWHSQIILMRQPLKTLYGNIKCKNNSLPPHPAVKEIYQPAWGIQIDFQDRDPSEVAKILYEAVQVLRLRAQLKLSYNLYIESSQPNLVSILFRETWKECPFQTADVLAMIARMVDKETSEKIAKSDNQFWKWAWLELIGGLPARDESFNDGKFSNNLWSKLYQFIELQERYRSGVWNNVVSCLSRSL